MQLGVALPVRWLSVGDGDDGVENGMFGKLSTAASCRVSQHKGTGTHPDHSPCIEDIVVLRRAARTVRAVRLVAGAESFAKRFRMRMGRSLMQHQRLQFKRLLCKGKGGTLARAKGGVEEKFEKQEARQIGHDKFEFYANDRVC